MKIIMKIALMILIAGALYNCGEFPLNCDVNDEACLMQEENNARQSISTEMNIPSINSVSELDDEIGGSGISIAPQFNKDLSRTNSSVIRVVDDEIGGS